MRQKRTHLGWWLVVAFLMVSLGLSAQQAAAPAPQLTRAQMEEFLLKAKVVKTADAKKGVTNTKRYTLTDGKLTHDASVQKLDETKQNYLGELMFRDSWKFNVAAYKLDQILGLNMVPVTVERSSSSYSWWQDDIQMDEETRQNKKLQAPDQDGWNKQLHLVNVFDNLIYNVDRNKQNLLIDNKWQLWMIDHSRSFRTATDLFNPAILVLADSSLLEKMKQLDQPTLTKEFKGLLDSMQIKGLLARRDKIVKLFEQKGPSAVYTYPRRP